MRGERYQHDQAEGGDRRGGGGGPCRAACSWRFADRLGLADLLSARIPIMSERLPVHDRGKVLVQAMLMMAGGGEACSDIEKLRAQPALFGEVPSDSTLYRTFFQLEPATVAGCGRRWPQPGPRCGRATATIGNARVVLDIDSSLHQIHSENKELTGPTYKGGFGFHPVYCFADATGETLAVTLRPGNAGANNVIDLVGVLDPAIDGLPGEIAAGHRVGDDPGPGATPGPGPLRLRRGTDLRPGLPGPQRRFRRGGPLQ